MLDETRLERIPEDGRRDDGCPLAETGRLSTGDFRRRVIAGGKNPKQALPCHREIRRCFCCCRSLQRLRLLRTRARRCYPSTVFGPSVRLSAVGGAMRSRSRCRRHASGDTVILVGLHALSPGRRRRRRRRTRQRWRSGESVVVMATTTSVPRPR